MGNRNSLLEKLGRLYAHCSLVVANSNTSHDGIAKKFFFFIPREIAGRTIKFCANVFACNLPDCFDTCEMNDSLLIPLVTNIGTNVYVPINTWKKK